MVHRIYPAELQLYKANASDNEAAVLDLNLSIHNDTVSTKIYDKRDDFDIVNFPFLDGDVPRRPSYGVYMSELIRFARASSHVDDFNNRCQNFFGGIRLLHSHLQYVCNIHAKYWMHTLKALEGVDFTKYALSPIIWYVQWSKIG